MSVTTSEPQEVGPGFPGEGSMFGGQPVRPMLWLGLITVTSILTQGYIVGGVNHGLQIPLIRHYAGDPSFDHDPFITDLAHTYTTAFYPLVGMLAKFIPLHALLFILFALFRFLTAWLGYRLSLALWRDGHAALWTAAALCVQTYTFASDFLSDIYLTHGALAQVLGLAALDQLARGRTIAAMTIAGLLFNFHPLHSSHLCGSIGLAILVVARDGRTIRNLALASIAGIALMVPTLYWMRTAGVMGVPTPDGYVDAIRSWFPTHFWLSSWGVADWIAFLFPMLAAIPLWRIAGPTSDDGKIARVVAVSLILATLGGIVAERVDDAFLIRFHPMRWSWVAILAGMPFFARACVQLARRIERPDVKNARVGAALGVMMFMGLGLGVLYRTPYFFTLLPGLWLISDEKNEKRAPVYVVLLLVLAGLVPWALVESAGIEMVDNPYIEGNLRKIFTVSALVGGLAVAAIVSAWLQRMRGPHTGFARRSLVNSALLIAAVHMLARGAYVHHTSRKGLLFAWRDVQEWCAGNLQPGELVMVPLSQMGLRTFSNQVPAVDFQEGDAMTHNPAYTQLFFDKLALYGWTPGKVLGFSHVSSLEPLDANLTAERAREIGRKLGAHVAIRRVRHPAWKMRELYSNDRYVVYRLDDGNDTKTQ